MSTDVQREINIRSARGWRPTAGDTLTGTVAHIGAGESEYGRYPVVTMAADTADPETTEYVAVHAFHSTLRRDLTTHRPAVGDRLTISYKGLVQGKGQREDGSPVEYHLYEVTPEKAENFWAGF